MTYDEFISKSPEYYMDMVRLIDIKLKHRMELTSEEKEINGYILQVQEQNKLNELRNRFQNCWELDK
jgi:hypothetical protein